MAIGVGLTRTGGRTRPGVWPTFEVYIPEVDLPVDDDAYPYIRLIDPYDDTIFSAYQCAVVLADFDRLAAQRLDEDTRSVLALIQRCAGDPSKEIWFVGD